jgi:hypothetical protein
VTHPLYIHTYIQGEGRVYGALKRDYLATGANPYRKSSVPQQVGGLGLRLTSSSCQIIFQVQNLNKTIDGRLTERRPKARNKDKDLRIAAWNIS